MNKSVERLLREGCFDHLDFGCSNGRSLEFARKNFAVKRGLGVDKSKLKVAQAREKGHEAFVFDVEDLVDIPNCVSIVTMSHFLEHLPGFDSAKSCLLAGFIAARDFVVCRQPWFDSDGYLAQNGLKCFWSDWTGHTFSITTLDLLRITRELPTNTQWSLYGIERIKHSGNSAILPLSSPQNQHHYIEEVHGPKKLIQLTESCFYQTLLIVSKQSTEDFKNILNVFPKPELLFSS